MINQYLRRKSRIFNQKGQSLPEMILGILGNHVHDSEIGLLSLIHSPNSAQNALKTENIRPGTEKIPRKKIWEKLFDVDLSNDIL